MKQKTEQTSYIKTLGMTCGNCEKKVSENLKELAGVISIQADFVGGHVRIRHNGEFSPDEALRRLSRLGYEGRQVSRKRLVFEKLRFYIISSVIIGLMLYINQKTGLLNRIPRIPEEATYMLLLVLGIMTSVHCIGMCGGINLSQTGSARLDEPGKAVFRRGLAYNAGRIISYTLVGALAGALGSVFSLALSLQAAVISVAGVFMVAAGFHMLGFLGGLRRIFPGGVSLPFSRFFRGRTFRHPLAVGIANGLMPCGPLQSMQLYALSTGSFWQGALSMFFFSVGTVPLMLLFGSISAFFSLKSRRIVHRTSGLLVLLLGAGMILRGLSLQGVGLPVDSAGSDEVKRALAVLEGSSQVVESAVTPYGYEPIVVQKGIPVEWRLSAGPGDITGCNNAIIVREYGIEQPLDDGITTVEFLPVEAGTYLFSCWMGMISSHIVVVDDLSAYDPAAPVDPPGASSTREVRVKIPEFQAEDIAYSRQGEETYEAELLIENGGLSPAVIVMKRGAETRWHLSASDVDSESRRIVFPSYNAVVDVPEGESTVLTLVPEEDFYFYSSDGEFLGFVVAADDPGSYSERKVLRIVNSYLTSP